MKELLFGLSNMRKIVLLCFSFLSVSSFSLERPPQNVSMAFSALGIEKTLTIFADELKKKNGTMLDERTRQINVGANGKNLNSTLQVSLKKSEVNVSDLKRLVEKKLIPMTCTAPINVMTITDMGARYTFHYYDSGHEFLFSSTVDKETCKNY